MITKGEEKLYILGQEEGQINIVCHVVPAQETERPEGKRDKCDLLCQKHESEIDLLALFST